MQVKKMSQEMVYPATPSPGGTVELSTIDQIMPPIYTSLVLFFDEKPAQEPSSLLKSSLSETLSLFYPVAGRLRNACRINGELEIVCSDKGASFHEAWVDCGLDEFLPSFDPHPDFALLVPHVDASANISEVPLVLAQITHFECSRICLGIKMHHKVCDGFSTSHFLSCWAILANAKVQRGLHYLREDCQLQLIKPDLERALLKAKNRLVSTCINHPEYQTAQNFLGTWPSSTTKVFPFTPSFIDDLRAKTSSQLTAFTHTRFEALAAHLWRGIIHARALAPNQEIRLGMPVDGRRRFNPPLADGYLGNVVFYGYTVCKAQDLVERPLRFSADLVKSAIAKVDDAHMRSALDWVAKQKSPKSVIPAFCTPAIDLSISSWTRFPFYDLDFGWGKPSCVRIPVPILDGVIILLPSPLGAGHVDAVVGLDAKQMPKFEHYINQL